MISTQTLTSSMDLYGPDDPFALALKPPPTETEVERQARINAELEAKRVSDEIDEGIRAEREMKKKLNMEVKLLLLGQAESGKSTLQKQFQLLYAPASLDDERDSWRAVVYFNVMRTIKRILQVLDTVDLGSIASPAALRPSSADLDATLEGNREAYDPAEPGSPSLAPLSPRSGADAELQTLLSASNKTELATLKLRLSPLVTAEAGLAEKISGGVQISAVAKRRGGGVYVRSGWQSNARLMGPKRRAGGQYPEEHGKDPMDEELDRISRMLFACRDDIKALWSHPIIKLLIEKRKLRLQESAEFFLSSVDRVASFDYTPSIDDILRSRLQTMGIASHSFNVQVSGKSVLWHLYDVGGARGQRHTWIPYFDDANAIIFLAPVSAFDQYLEEEPKMNRINDSLQLFTMICSNELLKRVHLVLFLNKTDILQQKLDAKVSVKRYIPSYGDRPNTYDSVVEYFRTHFVQVHRRNNEEHRVLYTHFTNVVDTGATQGIIRNVRDSIFRGYLQEASLV